MLTGHFFSTHAAYLIIIKSKFYFKWYFQLWKVKLEKEKKRKKEKSNLKQNQNQEERRHHPIQMRGFAIALLCFQLAYLLQEDSHAFA